MDVIKGHREMGGLVGYEFELTHLTDEHARFVVEEWSKVHLSRAAKDESEMDYVGIVDSDWDRFCAYSQVMASVEKSVLDTLSPEEIAELKTIYYIGRERLFSEVYEKHLEGALKAHHLATSLAGEIRYLMTKTNLLDALACGVEILGRRRLAAELRFLRPVLRTAVDFL